MTAPLIKWLRGRFVRRKLSAVAGGEMRRAGSPSVLLQNQARAPYVRPRARRFALVAGGGLVLLLVGLMTSLKLWPSFAPFDAIYRFHDEVWLWLKGWLWTAWYPYSLILWLPTGLFVALMLWGWTSGQDPSRPFHRMIILFLSGLLRLRVAGKAAPSMGLVEAIIRWGRFPGLATDYMELVIRHALDHQFEKMESALLAGQDIDVASLRQADRLMRVRALFPAKETRNPEGLAGGDDMVREEEARWLEAFFDLAFLSHVDRHQDIAIADYLAELVEALDPEQGRRLVLLNAFLSARPLSGYQDALWQAIGGIEQLTASASAQMEQMRKVEPDSGRIVAMLASCAFAFLAVADKNWAVASLSTLSSLERAYTALRLSDDYQRDADELGWWIARSRLATIRLQHQNAHQRRLSADELMLWPDGGPAYHSLTGASLAAGGA